MTRTKTQTRTIDTEKLFLGAACTCMFSLFALYIYFVSASVLHVVMRQETERQLSSVYSEIAKLEASYIRAQHSVSEDIASMHGYVNADSKIFIDRSSVAAVALSRNSEQ